jgi:hypothetical protein
MMSGQGCLPQPMLETFRNCFDAVLPEGVERRLSILHDKAEIMWAGLRPAGTMTGHQHESL